jgi:hypothetical protein
MDTRQEETSQDGLANGGMESEEQPTENANGAQSPDAEGQDNTTDPLFVQKRLKQQKRSHDREIRALNARIEQMQSAGNSQQSHTDNTNPYAPGNNAGGIEEQIHKAVSYALNHRDMEERKAKDAEAAAHVQKQYQALNQHLDSVSDKYDDFDDVVRGQDTPFTPHMRDAALFLDMDSKNPGSAGEVLYKLAKNPEELSRISKLHPLDQAREMVKLSKAMIGGGEQKPATPRPLGQIKNTPVTNSHAVTEKTPIGNLRQRMKSGNWK